MISREEIEAAARSHPGWDAQQIEQDIVLGRLITEIAGDDYLARTLVLKGGTCLHKLWLPQPWRYSKDLDYDRTENTPLGATFESLRAAGRRAGLDGAKMRFTTGRLMSHATFRGTYVDGATMKISVDIPTSPPPFTSRTERRALTERRGPRTVRAEIVVVTPEEIIASKAAAVFGRRQPRDAYDIWAATEAGLVTAHGVAACFQNYRQPGWSEARATRNLDRKWADPSYVRQLEVFGVQAPAPFDVAECRATVHEMISQCSVQSRPVPEPPALPDG